MDASLRAGNFHLGVSVGKGSRGWWRRQAIKTKQQRVLKGLKWVIATTPPSFANGPRRLTGSAARGKAYEAKVAGLLKGQVEAGLLEGELYIGPWFKFEDEAGPGLAQPDALLVTASHIIIVEVKLKQTQAAFPQISLYGQLAKELFGKPWLGVQVYCYPSIKRNAAAIDSLLHLLGDQNVVENTNGSDGAIFEWHWLGT